LSDKYLYSVRNWDAQYENNITRKIKSLNWVATPNKHDGRGFRRLMRMRDGVALYGAWHLILQVASKMPQRGVLKDTDGPLSAADIADKTGATTEVIARALEACASSEVGWLHREILPTHRDFIPIERENLPTFREEIPTFREEIPASPEVPGPDPGVPGPDPDIPGVIEGNRREGKGREQKGSEGGNRAAHAPPLTASEFVEPDRQQMAWALIEELTPRHWATVNVPAARQALERVLADAVHPQAVCDSIRANHATFVLWLAANPRERKKPLQFWLTDGDYLAPAPLPHGSRGRPETTTEATARRFAEQARDEPPAESGLTDAEIAALDRERVRDQLSGGRT
jgi:hypothetical protein